ncbi:hypothetical protein NW895_00825 [Streptomyces sp. S.PNR 29]|nr:hypothetical protein [Streptomyces sp. S.PNR 29]MDN0193583.1 hypothetical protein [Streptomyces sp. S.PNR 29]
MAYGKGGTGTRHSFPARVLLALCAVAALFATATTPARAATDTATQTAHLADRLRANPVYVTDQLPREIPRSTAPKFAELAKRTGVPTYVIVLPSQSTHGTGLLAAVHDRLGEDGLYVLIDESTVAEASAYGVRAPADDAATAVLYELPYDAGPLLSFQRFVEVVAQGSEKAAARAEAAREKYGDGDEEPADMYIGPSDRRNQSFLTGMLLTGVPLLILLLVPYVRRWRRRLPGAARKQTTTAAGTRAAPGKSSPSRTRATRWITPALALTAAVTIAVTATLTFDQTRSSASPPPRAVDLNARIDRVAAGLAEDPVYADPESPRVLDDRQLTRLHARIRHFEQSAGGGPVFVALVPQLAEDESAGDEEAFAAAVHDKVGTDGVYVVADPLGGYIDVFNYGLRLDSLDLNFDLPDSITYGDDRADEADDHLLGERLDSLMTVLDKAPRTEEPDTFGAPYPVDDPIAEDDLPPLFATDFWPGLFMGVLAAALLFGLTAGVLRFVRRALLRRNPEPLPTEALPLVSPTEPSESYLRQTARTELLTLAAEFGAQAREGSRAGEGSLPGDRFDAALLLVDGNPEAVRRVTDPATLVTVIVLARAARQALAGDKRNLCCAVNPLHGPAVSRHHLRVSAEGNSRRLLPVCALCRDTAVAEPREVHQRFLTLPAPGGQGPGRVPYEEYGSPLSILPAGIARLVDSVRESVHVH